MGWSLLRLMGPKRAEAAIIPAAMNLGTAAFQSFDFICKALFFLVAVEEMGAKAEETARVPKRSSAVVFIVGGSRYMYAKNDAIMISL